MDKNQIIDGFLTAAIKLAEKLGVGMEKAIDLAIKEAPELYNEVLWYIRLEILFVLIPSLVALVSSALIARKMIKGAHEYTPEYSEFPRSLAISCAYLASLALLAIPSHMTFMSTKELIQLSVAPRVYLAKKAFEIYRKE